MIPLARLIQQFHGIGKVESRVMTVLGHHRTRPGMLELNAAFGIMKTHGGTVSLYFDGFNTEIGHAPHFVKYHFGITSLLYFLYGSGRYPKNFVLGIVVDDAVHLLKVRHITGTGGFLPVDPQLAEVQRSPVERWNIGYPPLSLFFPVFDFYSPVQNGIAIRSDDSG